MFGKLFGSKTAEQEIPGKDRAIIHETVPDEVLYPDGKPGPEGKDMSWLDAKPENRTERPPVAEKPAPAPAQPKARPPARPQTAPATPPVAPEMNANAPIEVVGDRPPFPYGWLVVVEGPGTGAWFPLLRGRSDIGVDAGQTIRLAFGDPGIAAERHASLAYDETRHAFILSGEAALRLNGSGLGAPTTLRDGDVFTLGGTSLRLVALCSQNFHWAEKLMGR